ncbi:MAG TPA: DUF2027 domain-containing protein [Cytophagales bacterium]|nr:DUF2027 domain-containing protein [Cytophagales bacterium]
MNIGDRVRLLHGKEEGIVVAVKDNIIEIEIEDGFTIPASKNEVVLVSKEEALRFRQEEGIPAKEEKKTSVFAERGIFFAVSPVSQTTFELYLINNTDYTISLNLFQDQKNHYKGIFTHLFRPKTGEFVKTLLTTQDQFPEYMIQGLYFTEQMMKLKEPLIKRIRIKPFLISGNQTKAPIVGKSSYLIQIDGEQAPINSKKIKEMLEESPSKSQGSYTPVSPGREIDLHIEKLSVSFQNMSNSEILRIQLNAFESALDSAVASGQDEIKFIHGVGNGVLRKEIQKRLSKLKNIKFFEDVMKDRFGFGATLVRIR